MILYQDRKNEIHVEYFHLRVKFRLYVHVPLMGNRSLDNKKVLLQQKLIKQVGNNHILRLKFFIFRLYLKGNEVGW